MSTTDNKVKLQLRPTLPGANAGAVNRPDKNPSPSKLMINHGKPNYTINRSTSSPKTNPVTTDTQLPSFQYSLKSTNSTFSSATSVSSKITSSSTSSSNQMEKVVLKHVQHSPITTNAPSTTTGTFASKPPTASSSMQSFVSPGISSKAAATSFGVKLKQCNNKKTLQNGGSTTITNGGSYQNNQPQKEPEFVRRQKQIFEKLQQREQQEQHHVSETIVSHNGHNGDAQSQQNGHESYVKNVSSRLESTSMSSTTTTTLKTHSKDTTSEVYNRVGLSPTPSPPPPPSATQQEQKQTNNTFKLPPGAMCGKPAIPGKPANLQIPSKIGIVLQQQQQQQHNNISRIQNSSENIAVYDSNESLKSETTNTTETTTTQINSPQNEKESSPAVDECEEQDVILPNSNGANFEPKTVVSFSKELSSEPNRYPDTVKVTKSVSNGNSVVSDDAPLHDDDADSLCEFLATENSLKLGDDVPQLKFDIKTDDEDVTVTPVVIR